MNSHVEALVAAAQEALDALQNADSILEYEGINPVCENAIEELRAALAPFLTQGEK